MTTNQQRRLYFPAWSRAFKAAWQKDLTGNLILTEPAAAHELACRINGLARAKAGRAARAMTVDDLRHASHLVACGRSCSSKDLNNHQLDRLLVLFALMVDPDDLTAVMAWGNPNGPDVPRMIWSIGHCGFSESYIETVCAGKFGHVQWRNLDPRKLQELVMTLKNRRRSKEAAVPVGAENNEPF